MAKNVSRKKAVSRARKVVRKKATPTRKPMRKPARKPMQKVKSKTVSKKARTKTKIPSAPAHWYVRVSRFNPNMDFVPRTLEYVIKPHPGESISDMLLRVKHTQDGSLTFRASCGYGGCGTCGVRVNGKPVLGCVTQVQEHVNAHGTIRIDPLYTESVIKDLVCEEGEFFHEYGHVKPWMVPRKHDEARKHKMSPQEVQKLGKSQQCIMCGICNAASGWEKTGELGPAAFVKGFHYAADARDGDVSRVKEMQKFLPVHYSLSQANECPRDIRPGDKIKWVKNQPSRKGKR